VEQHVRVSEIASKYDCDERTIKRKIRQDPVKFGAVKIGRDWRVNPNTFALALSHSTQKGK
jgi:hypothetical protein